MNINWDAGHAAADAAHFRMLDREHAMEVAMERQREEFAQEVFGQDLPSFLVEEAMAKIFVDQMESARFDEDMLHIVNNPGNCAFHARRLQQLIHAHAREVLFDPAILAKLLASGKYGAAEYEIL